MQHPDYGDFEIIDERLAMATKRPEANTKRLRIHTRYSLKYRAVSLVRDAVRRLRARS